MRRTKIVATIGPACHEEGQLEQLMRAGVDICRLNFAHGTPDYHRELYRRIREVSERVGKPVAILMDLPGPKIRTGKLDSDSVLLRTGDRFVLTKEDIVGNAERVTLSHPQLIDALEVGDTVLLSDGLIELRIEEKTDEEAICRVLVEGILTSRKGIAAPGHDFDLEALTDSDIEKLAFGLDLGVDMVGISFVRRARDIARAIDVMEKHGRRVPIVAKLETRLGYENLDEILEATDAIMVARGDLGVELRLPEIPRAQKTIIWKANYLGKPVITATQMLRSMIAKSRPTRAEVTDVANAIYDGSDALMLSEETAAGEFPTQSVHTMARVAEVSEDEKYFALMKERQLRPENPSVDAVISFAAVRIASELDARAIITPTRSGTTPRRIARYRPPQPIFAFTHRLEVQRELALVWGVNAFYLPDYEPGTDAQIQKAEEVLIDGGYLSLDDLAVYTLGVPAGGHTNLIWAARVKEGQEWLSSGEMGSR